MCDMVKNIMLCVFHYIYVGCNLKFMKKVIFLSVFISFCALAEQKYNPHTNKYETVRPKSQLKYNYMEEEWKYVAPNSKIEYNPLTDKYDMAPKEYVNKYNYMEGQWEKTHPNSQLKMNPTNGEFQYVAPNQKLEFNPYTSDFEYAQ